MTITLYNLNWNKMAVYRFEHKPIHPMEINMGESHFTFLTVM